MPGFDRSGPMGTGVMTGGKRGFCNTTDGTDADTSGAGYGFRRRCRRVHYFAGGSRRGFGQRFDRHGRAGAAPMRTVSPSDELEYLTKEAQNLESNLQTIKKQIDDLLQKSE